ncbi:MAG TPA: hypothetical protein VHZ50_02015, partial [Puia sp.]|nr:hypothetical protein [Puia sp.]
SATGYLNNDSLKDMVLIIESNDSILQKDCSSCDLEKNKARILLVLLKSKHKYKVICQHNYFIMRPNDGGLKAEDALDDISIDRKIFELHYQFLRGGLTYDFKYLNHDIYLIRAENVGVDHDIFYEKKFDFLRMKMTAKTGEISSDKNKIKITKIKLQRPRKLAELNVPLDWEVVKGEYL